MSSLLGAERMLLDLVTDLKKHYGVTCLVVLPDRGRLSDALTGLGTQCLFAEYGWWCHASELDFRTKTRIVSTSYELLNQKIVPALQIFDPDVIWTQTLVIPWGAMAAGHLNKPHVWYVTELGEADHGFDFFCPFQKVIDDIVDLLPSKVSHAVNSSWIAFFLITKSLASRFFTTIFVFPSLDQLERVFLNLLAPCELAFSLKLLPEKEPKTS